MLRGSQFVFKGVYRTVLINYPNYGIEERLLCEVVSDVDPVFRDETLVVETNSSIP